MDERRKRITELINEQGYVSFADLKKQFPQVSDMTLRRDLEYLDRVGQIIRIHGGAKSLDIVIGTEDYYSNRSAHKTEAKRQIAVKAASVFTPQSVIFIDSGSTTTEFCRCLPDEPCTIFTNSISCAYELARLTRPKVHMLGGLLNSPSLSINGTRSVEFLEKVNFSAAFFGATGYSTSRGFTCGEEEEFKLKTAVLRKSDQIIMLMDSSKVGSISTFTFASMEDVDVIVSDGNLNQAVLHQAMQHKVRIL
ncbi:MAG: DeoR/GlpR transcriptional regulator [Hungatella sp.]|nr:DeoR/GlpR transcriptional regulator [Hungatella sp.]